MGLTKQYLELNNLLRKLSDGGLPNWQPGTDSRGGFKLLALLEAVTVLKLRDRDGSDPVRDADLELERSTAWASRATWPTCRSCATATSRAVKEGQQNTYWPCGAVTGLDRWFVDDRCIFCGKRYDEMSSSFRSRGKHIVRRHQWGRCHQDVNYSDWDSMVIHLENFHGLVSDTQLARHGRAELNAVFRVSNPGSGTRMRRHSLSRTSTHVDMNEDESPTSDIREQLNVVLRKATALCQKADAQSAPFLKNVNYGPNLKDVVLVRGLKDLYVQSSIYSDMDGKGSKNQLVRIALRAACEERAVVYYDHYLPCSDSETDNENGAEGDDDEEDDE